MLRLGVDPARITVVGDAPADLEAALADGLSNDLLVISGGLGPTHDDRTIELLARAAGVGVHVEEPLREAIEERSQQIAARLNRPYGDFAEGVTKQATLPDGALWLGLVGTAPAVVLDTGSCVAVALPGPPSELQQLWPRVLETEPVRRVLASSQVPERRVLRFYGVSESAIARSLAAAGGDGGGVDVTICARDFELHVDLFVENGGAGRADAIERQLVDDAGRFLFARREVGTAELVLELLRDPGPDPRDGRVVHGRPRRGEADRRSPARATSSSVVRSSTPTRRSRSSSASPRRPWPSTVPCLPKWRPSSRRARASGFAQMSRSP